MKHVLLSLLFIVFFFSQNAFAAIYKCVNPEGKTYYNDKACPQDNEETHFKNEKDPKGGYIPPSLTKSKAAQPKDKEKDLERSKTIRDNKKPKPSNANERNAQGGGTSPSTSENKGGKSDSTSNNQSDLASNNTNTNSGSGEYVPLKLEQTTVEPKDEIR